MTIRHRIFYFSLLLVLLNPSGAFASPVELEIGTPEAVVGENLSFALKFSLEDESDTVDVSNVKYQGAALPYQITNQSNSSFTMVVNGKTIRSSSDVIRSYLFTLPTVNIGTLVLPEFSVSLNDKTYQVEAITFQVLAKPTSENLQFLVSLSQPQSYYYPSQIIDLKYQILYRNFSGSPAIEDISLPILQDMNFQLIPDSQTNFKLPTNGQQTAVNARQGRTTYQGKSYNSMEFHLKFRLMKPGDFHFANNIKMIVETGKRYRQRSFLFGPNLVNETKPIYADSPPQHIRVLELPNKNVPASFNGAIGDFKINVTPSSDTAIRVGDPITLSIEISGRGTWEFVKCPPISKDSNITDYFIVSDEPVIGEVNNAKNIKSFSVRLRVKSKTIKEIPAIAFTYFNLSRRKYMTVHSAPVPITVFAASQTAKVTDFNTLRKSPAGTEQSKGNKGQEKEPLVSTDGTRKMLQSPQEITPILPALVEIGDNVPYEMTVENHEPRYNNLLFALGPLATVFCLYLLQMFRRRDINEEKAAKHKSSKAFKGLMSGLKKLTPKDENISAFSGTLGRRLHTFIEDRFLCTIPHPDAHTMQPLIERGEISNSTAQQFLDIVENIDQHRYATNANNLSTPTELLTHTIEALQKCDL